MGKFLLVFLGLFLFTLKPSYIDNRKLIGKWQLSALYIKNNNIKQAIDLEKYSDCEKRSTIEFKDSTMKSVSYSTFYSKKVWCFKDAKTYIFKVNYERDKCLLIGKISRHEEFNFTIVSLNDSILELEDRSFFKQYKKVISKVK
jgi:hypothetical protein